MKEIEFGRLIEKLIYFSGQKNYSLAVELGYDVSYISKWINSTMLPTSKNIKNICKNIADFTVDSARENSINEMIEYFSLDVKESDSNKKQLLKEIIEVNLNQAYKFSSSKLQKKSYSKSNPELNSLLQVNPSLRKKYLDDEVNSTLEKNGRSDIIILCNLFSLNKDDKIPIAGIRRGDVVDSFEGDMNIKFLINFENNSDDIIFDIMLLLNMIRASDHYKFEFYSCDFSSKVLILCVKDKLIHTAIYNDNNKCLCTTVSNDINATKEMYDTLEDMANNQSIITFKKESSEDIILNQTYMAYIMGQDLKWIIGKMNELLMPSDLFLEISENVFGHKNDIMDKLRKIDVILQKATYESNLKITIFESAIRKYASTGELDFFNIPIKLTMEQRERHLEYIKNIIENKRNISLKIIESSLISELKDSEKPTVYLSKSLSILKQGINNELKSYLLVKDKKLDAILDNFFETIWNDKKDVVLEDEYKILEIIINYLKYLKILNQ